MRGWFLPALAAILLAGGCATLSEGECLTADWYDIGFEDANRGHDPGRLSAHRDACGKHGVAPEREAYAAGHRDGLRTFCTPRRGYEFARDGNYYGQTCPAELERAFLDGYQLGSDVNRSEQELNSLASEIEELEEDLADEPDEEKRKRLRRKIEELDDRRAYLRRHIDRLEWDARRL